MVGRSGVMLELFDRIRRFAPHVRTALVTGETGTGKELVARALHKSGPARNKKFVTINCSAVVESLFESELFGHMRGAFTGAVENKLGLFEVADGGTLFLDEIGELPAGGAGQAAARDRDGEVQRVGGPRQPARRRARGRRHQSRPSDGIGGGPLPRRSLLSPERRRAARHAVAERREDIPYLTAAFVRHFAGQFGKSILGPTPAAERLLLTAPWPGNVRELRNVIERICILTEDRFFTEKETARRVDSLRQSSRRSRQAPRRTASACRRRAATSPRAQGHGRQQEGRGPDARPQPPGALPKTRPPRPSMTPVCSVRSAVCAKSCAPTALRTRAQLER